MINWFNFTEVVFADAYTSHDISITTANKFKGDFNGLLLREFQIPEKHLIPNLIINGLDTSASYDGKTTTIKIIDSARLSVYG